jgi:hypothetical protein
MLFNEGITIIPIKNVQKMILTAVLAIKLGFY